MPNLEISTVGASFRYAVETTAGTRPTSGYTLIPHVNSVGLSSPSVNTGDVSNIQDKVSRSIPLRQDFDANVSVDLIHAEKAIDAWALLVATTEAAKASNLAVWYEMRYPTPATKSYYFYGEAQALKGAQLNNNEVSHLTANIVRTSGDDEGWFAKSTAMTLSATTATCVKANTATITVTNSTGTITVTSGNTAVCTVAESSGTITITGVEVGKAVVTVKDEYDEAMIIVTVTAA